LPRKGESLDAAAVAEAERFIQSRLLHVREDPGAAFDPEFLQAAAIVERHQAAWARLRAALQPLPGIEWRRFTKAVMAAAPKQKARATHVAANLPLPDLE
jgi:hypothetical protein